MEKQAYLPIKFYPVKEWQEYEELKTYAGDYALVKEYFTTPPAFQMVIGDIGRHWSADSFILGTFDLVNYNTGTTYDLTAFPQTPIMYRGDDFRTLVFRRFPRSPNNRFGEGRYYYHLIEVEGQTEWFSEVFELCDFDLDAFDEVYTGGFLDNSGFASISSTYQNVWRGADCSFCKTSTVAAAWAYMEFTAFLEEEFDLYVKTSDRTGTCGGIDRDWDHPIFFYLRTQDGVVISDIHRVDTTDTCYHFKLKAQAGGLIRLYFYILDPDATEGTFDLALYRTHTEKHVQMRWFNENNFCKIIYDQFPEATPFQYENIYLINAKQIINENSINENVVEDDAANKYRIIGTDQKWNSLQLFGSECMLNAMSLLRLHSNIEIIKENGEPVDVVEMIIEQSVVDNHGALVNLVYREESCSENNCGFDVCCPGDYLPTMIGVFNGVGALPAAANYNGRSAMVIIGARNWQEHLSNGAAWNLSTVHRIVGACVEIQNHYGDTFDAYTPSGQTYSFFHTANTTTNWYPVVDITLPIVDAGGGQAQVTIYADYWFGANVVCQVEYYVGAEWVLSLPFYIDQENWIAVSEKENLTTQTGARVLTASCGVGTFYFRVHIWDGDCDLGYCLPSQQTIT